MHRRLFLLSAGVGLTVCVVPSCSSTALSWSRTAELVTVPWRPLLLALYLWEEFGGEACPSRIVSLNKLLRTTAYLGCHTITRVLPTAVAVDSTIAMVLENLAEAPMLVAVA